MPGHFHFFAHTVTDNNLLFDEIESQHMVQVLRYDIGHAISATDGKGTLYKATITTAHKKQVIANIESINTVIRNKHLQLGIGTLKNTERMEWLVEKCTELQVESLTFLHCQNSEKRKLNLDRLKKKALSALKQSHGAFLPTIHFETYKEFVEKSDSIYIAHCNNTSNKYRAIQLPLSCTVLIGPEGDFTTSEIALAKNANALEIDLGNSILRTETAVIATASVHYLL